MHFYDSLRSLRKLSGYTIREVASRSGVSAAYISQLENGNRGIPSPEILMKLSEGLNASYKELMNLAGYLELKDADPAEARKPINMRRFLQDNEIQFDGQLLSEQDKEWVERVMTALFWKQKQQSASRGTSLTNESVTEE